MKYDKNYGNIPFDIRTIKRKEEKVNLNVTIYNIL